MGAVSPILPVISGITSAVKFIDNTMGFINDISGRNARSDLRQMQERHRLEQQNSLTRLQAEQRQRAELARQAESERIQAVRRAVARQRAAFGSQGVGSASGSSNAVLLGLFTESDEERAERERLDSLRNQIDESGWAGQNATNLLLQTQLQERQKLQHFYLR